MQHVGPTGIETEETVLPEEPQAALLGARDVHLSYGSTRALVGANFSLEAGEIVALTGRSGSGKSSLLYVLAGIVPPTSGDVWFDRLYFATLDDDALSALRRRDFGFVFQFGELVPELTIFENVSLPLRLLGHSSREVKVPVLEMLDRLDIEGEKDKRPSQVSGGQAQRAAVARALIHQPKVVFADEPTGSLDSENAEIVLHEFVSLARSKNAAVIIVTHEPSVAAVADRQMVLRDGVVYAATTP